MVAEPACSSIVEQTDRRVRGLKITDRLLSLADPDAWPIRKGKLGKPTEFGYVAQLCEVTENTRRGARGLSSRPATRRATRPKTACRSRLHTSSSRPGSDPGDRRRRIHARTDPGGFPNLTDQQIQLCGRYEPGSRRTRKRRSRYRTGGEGRIGHPKRRYGLRRARLKGHDGLKIWAGWAILAYDLDTFAIRTR